ncbi:MAG TPA: ankyrin repeat domain-containing protein [Thermoanaerobaculia bacterium]|nr:ankyrin repeat domain-containing protein [Thermoanaerobaculia bacterium]
MQLRRRTLVALMAIALCIPVVRADNYEEVSRRVDAAKAAVESGKVVPERDIAPLIDMLRTSKDDEDQRSLVDAIVDLGEGAGSSPVAVKRYILEQATPILMDLASNPKNSTFLRGDAITGLRNLGASKSVLQKAADMALKDSDDYVKSRGEILQNYIRSMPEESKVSVIKTTDPAKEQEAIAFLKSHDVGVSLDQLKRSAGEGNAEEVAALLAAGVDAKAGAAGETALDSAILGCARGGESAGLLKSVDLLLAAGADVKRRDDNKNTPLMSAAQYCGAGVVGRLVKAGADPKVVNGSGTTPLMMALMMKHVDAAELLVAKGATLTPNQATAVSSMATDAKSKALIQKATKRKAK